MPDEPTSAVNSHHRGRRTRRTLALTQALCDVLKTGGTRTAACAHVGIDRSLFYDWLQFPSFSDAVARAEAEAELRFGAVVMQAAVRENDWRAAAFWLERRRPEEWGERQRVDVTMDVAELLRESLVARSEDQAQNELGALAPPTVVDVTPDEPPDQDPSDTLS